jgi:type IV secretory pathway VirJ component
MKRAFFLTVLPLFLTLYSHSQEFLNYGQFGKVNIYRSQTKPVGFVIFASGEDGLTNPVIDIAIRLMQLKNVTVALVNTPAYLAAVANNKSPVFPASDFENLAKYAEQKTGMDKYYKPVLIGYSAGAALVYASLAQAADDTFAGAVTLAFLPDIRTGNDFVRGAGLAYSKSGAANGVTVEFKPSPNIKNKWIALQGTEDKTFNPERMKDFTSKMPDFELTEINGADHSLNKESLWINDILSSYDRINAVNFTKSSRDIGDLPIVEVREKGSSGTIALILTGDGGWTTIDKEIGNSLIDSGMGVIGFNTLQYFWNKKDPDVTAKDLENIIDYYSDRNDGAKILLVGYSLGADVLPFVLTRLSRKALSKVSGAVFLGISVSVSFEFHLTDWIGKGGVKTYRILPEVERISGVKMLFMGGEKETDTLLPSLNRKKYDVILLPGGHHFDNNYKKIGDIIFQWSKK